MVHITSSSSRTVESSLSPAEKASLAKIFAQSQTVPLRSKNAPSASTLSREELAVRHVTDRLQKGLGGSVLARNEPFYLVDLGTVVSQMVQWRNSFDGKVRPHYAVKCNPNPWIIRVIHALGGGFDCASKNEIQLVMDTLKLSAEEAKRDILYANPTKQAQHVLFAKSQNVLRTTFDAPAELSRIKRLHPSAEVILRIKVDDSDAICQFSSKFGADLEDCPALISLTKKLGLNLVGVSFHVGSGCQNATAFVKAALDAVKVFGMAREQGVELKVLDIGGGFPGDNSSSPSFPEIVDELKPVLEEHFLPQGIEIVAEPGRYFAAASHTLATNIFSKKSNPEQKLYYVNDGVYQCFNCLIFDHAVVKPIPVKREKLLALSLGPDSDEDEQQRSFSPAEEELELEIVESQESLLSLCDEVGTEMASPKAKYAFHVIETEEKTATHPSTVFGPTCDSLDTILKDHPLPEMNIGDWLVWTCFGAYTISAASFFNGMDHPSLHYVHSLDL